VDHNHIHRKSVQREKSTTPVDDLTMAKHRHSSLYKTVKGVDHNHLSKILRQVTNICLSNSEKCCGFFFCEANQRKHFGKIYFIPYLLITSMFLCTLKFNARIWNTLNFFVYLFVTYALLSAFFSNIHYTETKCMSITNSELRSYGRKWS